MLGQDGGYMQFGWAGSVFASLVMLILGPCGTKSGLAGNFNDANS